MPDINKHLEEAEKLIQTDKLEEAVQACLLALKVDPNNDTVMESISELYLRLGLIGKGLESYGNPHEAAMAFARSGALVEGGAPEAPNSASGGKGAGGDSGEESNVLEDLMLQAEIFLQYGLKPRAVERLERIQKLFPGEEEKNEKLRGLFTRAGVEVQAAAAAAQPGAAPAAAPAGAGAGAEEGIIDITRVTEITRNIYRQGTVKNVLFAAVNDVGRTWRVSKCMAALCTPGKTPSALLEYCATGMKQSDVLSLVKLVHGTMQLSTDGTPLSIEDAESSSKLGPLAPVVKAMEIRSLLALPLMEAGQQLGVLVLEQCDSRRSWRSNEVMVLKTIVEQMVMATTHVKLRSLMKSLAVTDERSGMLHRSSYLDCLFAEAKQARKQSTSLCLALMQFGKGNQLVRESGEDAVHRFMDEAGQAITSNLRPNDVAIQYDITTLALVMPDTKGQDGLQAMTKMRRVAGSVKLAEKAAPPPLTIGLVEPILDTGFDVVDTVTELINRAEEALAAAHQEGGNIQKLLSPEA